MYQPTATHVSGVIGNAEQHPALEPVLGEDGSQQAGNPNSGMTARKVFTG